MELCPVLALPRAAGLSVGRWLHPSAPLRPLWKIQIINCAFFHPPSILPLPLAGSAGQSLACAVPHVPGLGSSLEALIVPGMIWLHCRCFL